MIQLNNSYNRDDFLKFLEDNFLIDLKKIFGRGKYEYFLKEQIPVVERVVVHTEPLRDNDL